MPRTKKEETKIRRQFDFTQYFDEQVRQFTDRQGCTLAEFVRNCIVVVMNLVREHKPYYMLMIIDPRETNPNEQVKYRSSLRGLLPFIRNWDIPEE